MDRKNKDEILHMLSIVFATMSVLICLSVLVFDTVNMHSMELFVVFVSVVLVVEITYVLWIRLKRYNKNDDVYKFDKLIEYSKKRSELEEEITLLTRELMHSNISEYLDVNRLVFSGQQDTKNNKSINYQYFLKQFGLVNEKIEVRKNSAVFLTPFNREGEALFKECQHILSGIDVFLQKTDNYVEKEDIMMNIISLIVQSEIVIVNINGRNPNVYYELGIAHAIGKPTILLSETNFNIDDVGFDIRQKRIIMYDSIQDLEKQLLYQVSRLRNQEDNLIGN